MAKSRPGPETEKNNPDGCVIGKKEAKTLTASVELLSDAFLSGAQTIRASLTLLSDTIFDMALKIEKVSSRFNRVLKKTSSTKKAKAEEAGSSSVLLPSRKEVEQLVGSIQIEQPKIIEANAFKLIRPAMTKLIDATESIGKVIGGGGGIETPNYRLLDASSKKVVKTNPRVEVQTNRKLLTLASMGTRPGSMYTHDIHCEKVLLQIAALLTQAEKTSKPKGSKPKSKGKKEKTDLDLQIDELRSKFPRLTKLFIDGPAKLKEEFKYWSGVMATGWGLASKAVKFGANATKKSYKSLVPEQDVSSIFDNISDILGNLENDAKSKSKQKPQEFKQKKGIESVLQEDVLKVLDDLSSIDSKRKTLTSDSEGAFFESVDQIANSFYQASDVFDTAFMDVLGILGEFSDAAKMQILAPEKPKEISLDQIMLDVKDMLNELTNIKPAGPIKTEIPKKENLEKKQSSESSAPIKDIYDIVDELKNSFSNFSKIANVSLKDDTITIGDHFKDIYKMIDESISTIDLNDSYSGVKEALQVLAESIEKSIPSKSINLDQSFSEIEQALKAFSDTSEIKLINPKIKSFNKSISEAKKIVDELAKKGLGMVSSAIESGSQWLSKGWNIFSEAIKSNLTKPVKSKEQQDKEKRKSRFDENSKRPRMQRLASGGPATPSKDDAKGTDTVPAMLTPGEFVVNKDATKKNRGMLEQINAGGETQKKSCGGPLSYLAGGGGVGGGGGGGGTAQMSGFMQALSGAGKGLGMLGAAGQMAVGAITGTVGAFSQITAFAGSFVQAFNPALMEQMNLVFKDLTAVIGMGLEPVIGAVIPIVRAFADRLVPVMQAMIPTVQLFADSMIELSGPIIEILIQAFAALEPIIVLAAGIVEQWANVLTWAVPLIAAVIKEIVYWFTKIVSTVQWVVGSLIIGIGKVLSMIPGTGNAGKDLQKVGEAAVESSKKASKATDDYYNGTSKVQKAIQKPVVKNASTGAAAGKASFSGISDLGRNLMQASISSSTLASAQETAKNTKHMDETLTSIDQKMSRVPLPDPARPARGARV